MLFFAALERHQLARASPQQAPSTRQSETRRRTPHSAFSGCGRCAGGQPDRQIAEPGRTMCGARMIGCGRATDGTVQRRLSGICLLRGAVEMRRWVWVVYPSLHCAGVETEAACHLFIAGLSDGFLVSGQSGGLSGGFRKEAWPGCFCWVAYAGRLVSSIADVFPWVLEAVICVECAL